MIPQRSNIKSTFISAVRIHMHASEREGQEAWQTAERLIDRKKLLNAMAEAPKSPEEMDAFMGKLKRNLGYTSDTPGTLVANLGISALVLGAIALMTLVYMGVSTNTAIEAGNKEMKQNLRGLGVRQNLRNLRDE